MTQKQGKQQPPAGEIRQSQILSTFGPGSMMDLPEQSIIVGGLNHWKLNPDDSPLNEPRLVESIKRKLGLHQVKLYTPPARNPNVTGPRTGINNFLFPGWFVAQVDQESLHNGKVYRTRPLLPWKAIAPTGGQYLHTDKKKKPVVPVRFVQACVHGHISDIDWRAFVHRGSRHCLGGLWLDEGGTGNDFADIFVRCEACEERRALSDATLPKSTALGVCRGDRPWLGPNTREDCTDENSKRVSNRLLVRSASNAYFAQTQSVISLPSKDEAISTAVEKVYENYLQYAENADDIRRERKKLQIASALEGFSDEVIWEFVQQKKNGSKALSDNPPKPKQVEIETLLSQPDEIGEDLPDTDFYARNLSLDGIPDSMQQCIDRIVLVHRLREVRAQISFTRFEPPFTDIDGELMLGVSPATLGLETDWFPAIETKGEGIFLSFKAEAIEAWLQRDAVKHRGDELKRGFDRWLQRREIKPEDSPFKFPGLPYIMLHSLSHLLITAISLECGYSASAVRERIYAMGSSGYGILLYTGANSSEGTLGGLIQVGRKIETHLQNALEAGRLCSNDPVCAQHKPDEPYEERFRHGAACHGCLLISETSCEQGNEFLDRALVVDTIETTGAAFFPSSLT
jgi:Domain of unknown function (DUF1998)